MELKITKEKVVEAAKECPDAKKVLEKMFPEAFKPEPFEFGDEHSLTMDDNGPLLIANGLAPEWCRKKCLAVSRDYRMEVSEYGGYQILTFYKKG